MENKIDKPKKPEPLMKLLYKHMELRKMYEVSSGTRIGDNKDLYIKYLESLVITYREKSKEV